jgi:predicted ATPase
MKYLYIDNFRGFTDTYIPIKDVNFLVGENSTGKTTVLSIINLLSSPEFWFMQHFNTDSVQFGYFKDMVNINSENQRYFRLGVIEYPENNGETQQKEGNVFLMTFAKAEGAPTIHRYNYMNGLTHVEVVFTQQLIKYKISQIDSDNFDAADIFRIFSGWVGRNERNKQKGFKVLNRVPMPFLHRSALANISNLIDELEGKKKKSPFSGFFVTEKCPQLPHFADLLVCLAPTRSQPKRTYEGYYVEFTSKGDYIPHLIRKILNQKADTMAFSPLIKEFGANSNLFESVEVKNFGRDSTSPFELHIRLNGRSLRINDVGYGVSQSLPVVAELLTRPKGSWFSVQQPEIHLHPKAQAALGDLFFKLAIAEDKKFFIETHSDYLIDRFRLNYRDSEGNVPLQSQVLFFEREAQGNQVYSIEIEPDGAYSEDQPSTFREFFIHEELKQLGL